jgi:hypothetical protein
MTSPDMVLVTCRRRLRHRIFVGMLFSSALFFLGVSIVNPFLKEFLLSDMSVIVSLVFIPLGYAGAYLVSRWFVLIKYILLATVLTFALGGFGVLLISMFLLMIHPISG